MVKSEPRTIDPRYYASVGYRFQPGYAIPKIATPHLVLVGDHTTPLCGAGKPGERSGHRRFEDKDRPDGKPKENLWEKPVCANCVRTAAQQGLVEQPPLKLRKGDCPVLSERTGELTKHIILPHRPRCKNCQKPEWNRNERCSARHRTYAVCRSCGFTDENHHYCDETVGRSMGIATDFGYCNRRADEQRHVPDRYHQPDGMVWHYLCKQHLPEAVKARQDASEARYAAERARWAERDKRDDDKSDAFDILVELARWVAKNRDLAAEDEWLGQIAIKLAGNDAVQAALEGKD